jgi:hypothetical protein
VSARDARLFGIKPRGDHEILEQNTPWTRECVTCLTCGQPFVSMHLLGTPLRDLACSFCGGHDIEDEAEAPLFLPPAIH